MKKIFILFLISINLLAWEVNTHRAIDREALKKVDNLEAFSRSKVVLWNVYINNKTN